MALEIRQMRHMLVLAELGSFARAAAMLNFSQSALSRSIQVVEQQVGAALFLPSAAGVVPTDIGRVLAQRARQVVQMAEDIEKVARSIPRLGARVLVEHPGRDAARVLLEIDELVVEAHATGSQRFGAALQDRLEPELREARLATRARRRPVGVDAVAAAHDEYGRFDRRHGSHLRRAG
jgi:hypothetical protein